MIRKIRPDLIQVRGWFVNFYILTEERSVYIIDGGFIGDFKQIEQVLEEEGFEWSDVKALLMTHGHLDHTYNVGRILERCDAIVYGHAGDKLHFAGRYPYAGISLVCGFLEYLGRAFFGYTPVQIGREIHDGEKLDIWGGLTVIHTPGHTKGHCGFYCDEKGILFSGDLFANWLPRVMLPWPWLNSCPELFRGSIRKVFALEPEGILANHCDRADPALQCRRFYRKFQARYESTRC